MFLWVINGICNTNLLIFSPAGFIFGEFPLVFLIVGFIQRNRRWKELLAGERWYTYSSGVSYLELLPLPAFLKTQRRLYRFCEPALCFILAMGIGCLFSQALGRWLAFSSFAIFLTEQAAYDFRLERDLDLLDSGLAAEVAAETVKHFEGPQPNQEPLTLEDTAGISTGISFDIQKQILSRRAERRAAAPDNLAPTLADNPVKDAPGYPA